MNKILDIHKSKLLGYWMSGCFLLIHIILFFLFRHYGVTPMVWFNAFSVLFYLGSFLLLKKDRVWIFVAAVYLEVAVHMALAVCFTGAESGFQITLIAMNIMLFYSEYLSISLRHRRVPALGLSIVGMALYLLSYIMSQRVPSPYPLPPTVCFALQIAWGVIVFTITIFILKLFVILASRSEQVLSDRATHDPLTGLYNRAGYEQRLLGIDVSSTVLLLIDADRFKEVNDNYGHETGDRILKKIADALRRNFRADDCLCRIGGDEFAVLMRSPEGLREELTTERVRDINSLLADTSDGLPRASVSVGAAFGGGAGSMDRLFENADTALYQRKREGRGGCTFYREPKKAGAKWPETRD